MWKLINDENYDELSQIKYGAKDNNPSDINMRPTDFYPVFEDIGKKSEIEFYEYCLDPFFDLLYEPTSQSLFANGHRILKSKEELKLFWRTEFYKTV